MLRAGAHPSPSRDAKTSGPGPAGARLRARTGCNRARLIAMAMVSIFAGIAQAQEDRIEAECRNLLHRSVFNCGCTAEFLENHLGGEQADILLRLWTYGENGGGQHNEMLDLYTRYGSDQNPHPVMKFPPHPPLLPRSRRQRDRPP